jgi:hypothetical protein
MSIVVTERRKDVNSQTDNKESTMKKLTVKSYVVLGFFAILGIGAIVQLRTNKKLEQDGVLTSARITGESRTVKGYLTLEYMYFAEGGHMQRRPIVWTCFLPPVEN